MSRLAVAVGVVMIVLGLLWALQGAGLLAWPAGSMMLSQARWVWIGLALALIGLGVVAYGRRR